MKQATSVQETIRLNSTAEERQLLGHEDKNLRAMRKFLGVRIISRGGVVTVQGERGLVEEAIRTLRSFLDKLRQGGSLDELDVESRLRRRRADREISEGDDIDASGRILRARDDTPIRPMSANQQRYIDAVRDNDIVFSIGPAGTGKTYLAVAMAIRMMRRGRFRKLCLVRPAVEAGEHLGFLPGDLQAKVSPYLRPLYDALGDFLEFGKLRRFQETDVIEVVPLAYMRGRTLDNAFIILDEGQNTTPAQMKMFLTRMGRGSKIVVTGDITQTDLPRGKLSGLVDVQRRLADVRGIAFAHLDKSDIVRHTLVQRIVDAYERGDGQNAAAQRGKRQTNGSPDESPTADPSEPETA